MVLRLHFRLVLWNLSIIILIAAILGLFVSYSFRNYIEDEIEEQLTDKAALIATYIAKTDAGVSAGDLATRLAGMFHVRVTLIAPAGAIVGDSELSGSALQAVQGGESDPEVVDAMQTGTGFDVRPGPKTGIDSVFVAYRAQPYVIRLVKPLSEAETLIADLRARLLLGMIIAVGVTLGFGYVAHGLISRPLQAISLASKRLAAGDLSQRLPISGDEEIATLGNALNTMAENLSAQMQALSEGKQRLELIVSAMSEGVMVLDSSGRISLTNRAVRGLLEGTRDLIGRTPLEVFRRPELENVVRSVLSGKPPEVTEMTTSTGRIVQANVAPVGNASGVIDSVVVVFHDLTDIRRTERMRSDFVANVSHEFKTPLTSIRGYAETLLAGAIKDRKIAADFLGTIERNAQYLESLVGDLLVLARLEADLPASVERVNVKNIVDEQIRARESVAAEQDVRVINECSSVEIRADRSRLSTALSNLIDNALHYNRPGGEVRITGCIEETSFLLAVADTGQGIPSEELLRIFERFYRVDKARSRESGGTGLGLSIVKHAIESQGGSIGVTSRIGVGSTFTIRLPA